MDETISNEDMQVSDETVGYIKEIYVGVMDVIRKYSRKADSDSVNCGLAMAVSHALIASSSSKDETFEQEFAKFRLACFLSKEQTKFKE